MQCFQCIIITHLCWASCINSLVESFINQKLNSCILSGIDLLLYFSSTSIQWVPGNENDCGWWGIKRVVGRLACSSQVWWKGRKTQFLAKLPRMMAETLLQNWLYRHLLHQNPDATIGMTDRNWNLLQTQRQTALLWLLCQELDLNPLPLWKLCPSPHFS